MPFSNNILTLLVAFVFLSTSMVLIFHAAREAISHGRQIDRRLAGATELGELEPSAKNLHLLHKLGAHLSLPNAEEITRIRHQLASAGYYDKDTVKSFYAARLICLIAPQIIILALWSLLSARFGTGPVIFFSAILALIGSMGPNAYIAWKKARRTQRCRDGFPDMMDLMVACIEAGLGMDAALIRVANELGGRYPALKVNLDIMNLELRAGQDRHKAMLSFAQRINLEEATALATMLKQAEDMGASIGKALRSFSEDMRKRRMLIAEEKAMALSAKLTVPLILFIFPTILVIVLMPAAMRLAGALG